MQVWLKAVSVVSSMLFRIDSACIFALIKRVYEPNAHFRDLPQ